MGGQGGSGRRATAICVALVVTLFAGAGFVACGASETPEQRVAMTLDRLRQQLDDGDFAAVCKGMTGQARMQATGQLRTRRCGDELARLLAPGRRSTSRVRSGRRDVLSVRVSDDRARATVSLNRWVAGVVRLIESDGDWKLAALTVRPRSKTSWAQLNADSQSFSDFREAIGRDGLCPAVSREGPGPGGFMYDGCTLRISTQAARLVLLTALGDFEVANCRASYGLYIDSANIIGQDVVFSGGPSCRKIVPCPEGTGVGLWGGNRMRYDHTIAVLRLNVCLNTPVGTMRGPQIVSVGHRGSDWTTAQPADHPVGSSPLQLGGHWRVTSVDGTVRLPDSGT